MCEELRSVADLVGGAQKGDRDAFAELYSRYQPYVLHGLLALGETYADAWDLTQETFLHAYRGLHTLCPERELRFGGWLRRIAMNVLRKHAPKARRAQAVGLGDRDFPELADECAIASGEDSGLDEEYGALYECLDTLAIELRRLVVYRFFFGDSGRQAARELSLTEATQRTRIKEAMELLRECLKSKGIQSA